MLERRKALYSNKTMLLVVLVGCLIFQSQQVIYDSEINIYYKINDNLKAYMYSEKELANFKEKYPDRAQVYLVFYVNLFTPLYQKVMRDGTAEEQEEFCQFLAREKKAIKEGKDLKIESESDYRQAVSRVFYALWSDLSAVKTKPDIKIQPRSRLNTLMSTIRGGNDTNGGAIPGPRIVYRCSEDLDIKGMYMTCTNKGKEDCQPLPVIENLENKVKRKKRRRSRKNVRNQEENQNQNEIVSSLDSNSHEVEHIMHENKPDNAEKRVRFAINDGNAKHNKKPKRNIPSKNVF